MLDYMGFVCHLGVLTSFKITLCQNVHGSFLGQNEQNDKDSTIPQQ